MHFDLIEALSLAGSNAVANDDRAGMGDQLAWVIDGATDLGEPGLLGTRGGAAWLAIETERAFAAATGGTIREVCADLVSRLVQAFDAARTRDPVAGWEMPRASFLAARLGDDAIELAWSGDCSGWLLREGEAERIGPPNTARRESEGAAEQAKHGLGSVRRSQPLLETLRESRSRNGHRVLGPDPDTIDHFGFGRVDVRAGDEIVLMSDGFAALLDRYEAMPVGQFAELLRVDGLASLATMLRGIEREDADCTRWPRYKKSDDATAIWLRVA